MKALGGELAVLNANQIISMLEDDKYINLAVFNNNDIMIESYYLWIDDELSCYCMQELYVHDGKIEEIGDTVNCVKSELSKRIKDLQSLGSYKIGCRKII